MTHIIMGQSGAALGNVWIQGESDPLGIKARATLHYSHARAKDHVRKARPKGKQARRAEFAATMRECRRVAREQPYAWYAERLDSIIRATQG